MINLDLGFFRDPPPERILQRFKQECFENVNVYPKYDELRSKMQQRLGAESIALVAGLDGAISLLSRAFSKDILIFPPTYYEYFHTPKRNNITVSEQNCFDGKEYKLPDKISGRSLVFIANPNNPFGLTTKEHIRSIVSSTDAVIAVDEAYIGFGGETVTGLLKELDNLVVLRTFSKSFAMAGARVGCIAGSKRVVEKAAGMNQFFSVASPSVKMALIALEEEDVFRQMREKMLERKAGFEEFLRKAGYQVMDSHNLNSVLKFESEADATAFKDLLYKNEIKVGQGDGISCYGLDNFYIRISCGPEEELEAVKIALS